MKNTILVTGGAGFIGSNFVINWVKSGKGRVVNLDLLTYAGNKKNLDVISDDPNHIFVQGDIADAELIPELLAKYQPQAILNFAAESHVDRSITGPGQFVHTNINGTYNLLEAARSYWSDLSAEQKNSFRFLHVSTDEVFGSLDESDPAFTEESLYQPNSPYSASKAASDHLVRAWHHTYGLPTLMTNCSNNYGPLQYPEKLIPLVITNALAGKILPIYGDGMNIRDWLHVDDHCSAIAEVLAKGKVGETYNVGSDNEQSNKQVVDMLCQTLDTLSPTEGRNLAHPKTGNALTSYSELIEFVKDRAGHDRRYAINAEKIQQELGWKAKESFETGLEKTVRWYLDNQKWGSEVSA
ncbi:dTDP-glucose 4,6-dehydratase [Rickettsiaceae bacterium]|nr:dTDP-glucose 4,6-dehydratase [Rickettsiaceae bacterium]